MGMIKNPQPRQRILDRCTNETEILEIANNKDGIITLYGWKLYKNQPWQYALVHWHNGIETLMQSWCADTEIEVEE